LLALELVSFESQALTARDNNNIAQIFLVMKTLLSIFTGPAADADGTDISRAERSKSVPGAVATGSYPEFDGEWY